MRTSNHLLLLPSVLFWACSGELTTTMEPNPESNATDTPAASAGPITGGTTSPPGSTGTAKPPAGVGTGTVVGAPTTATTTTAGPSVGGGNGEPSGTDLQGFPIYTRFSRLTNSQWANSVSQLLGLTTPPDTDALEDPVEEVTTFLNNERILDVTSTQSDAYSVLTESLVQQLSSDAAIAKIYAGTDSAGFIQTLGRRAYRRPLTATEVTEYQALFDAGSALSGTNSTFTKGAVQVLQAMLQSPHFIYRIEAGPSNQPLTGYEVAAKLSLWLLDRAPSDALLDSAESLTSADAVATAATAMLEQPAAAQVMREFFFEWMDLKRYNDINKDASFNLPEGIGDELKELSEKYFERIYSQNLGLKEILTGTQGYVGPKTSEIYGVQAANVTLQDFGSARVGYFAQVPYTLLYGSYGGQSDIIHRGSHLQRDILCGVLNPPEAAFTLPDAQPNQSNRERVELMTSADACTVCHGDYINPLGYAFENFDGLGRVRTTDNGSEINTAASYPFPEQRANFADHKALMEAAYGSEMAHLCYAKQIASYALGRDVVESDLGLLHELATTSQADGSMKDLIVQLVKSPAFLARSGETP